MSAKDLGERVDEIIIGSTLVAGAAVQATVGTALEVVTWPLTYVFARYGPADLRRLMEKEGSMVLAPHFKKIKESYEGGMKLLYE